ncbi:hypothetical protein GXP67_20665 [Rhodocytophaga rosea]|uniref:DUF4097 domain-containing protein n=1 Tax=Rhodocytophaga rosea TaxID=2704465 RepID=A0A6C0GLM2_9BACT|nr:hypothetical protein [Rhodocytophaga rosea]QHT68889.1 hypothetical protein GXP67_20665 [Rhodocytophaga rosea]
MSAHAQLQAPSALLASAEEELKHSESQYTIYSYDSELSKKISRSFNVSASDKLAIDNRYGKVHINTWDKNEITVNIEILARASSDSRAQEILDMITVDEEKTGGLISFKTRIGKNSGNNNWGKKSGYTINYTVSMPKKNPLQVKNMYGDMYLADYSGNGDISLSYGSMKLGRLSGENTVKLAYGSGSNSIAQLKQGSLDLAYSKLTLEETDKLDLNNSYSDINISRAGNLTMESKYGSVEIGSVNAVEGSSGYSGFRIGSLADKLDLNLRYCSGFKIGNISPKFNSITLDGNYSSFDLNFAKNASFNFDVDLQYADLQVDKDQVVYKVVEKRNTSSKYEGKYGKSNAQGMVKIASRYGSVKFEQED